MSISKKVFSLALGTLLVTSVSPVYAQRAVNNAANKANQTAKTVTHDEADKTEEVLFKIHNIVPVKNSENEVVACDFDTTFYNRSPYNIKEASLELKWKDTSIEDVIENEKAENKENKRNTGRSYSETQRRTSEDISVVIDVPAVNNYKQVTVNNRINTDRCFLLIENVDFSVSNCFAENLAGSSGRTTRRNNRSSACSRLFKYVSPEDAQYYLEFKEITPEEENTREEAEKQASKKETNDIYTKTVNSLNSASSTIMTIK